MTITYPRTLPSTRVLGITFEPEPQESFAPEHGGRFVSVMLGPTMWGMKLATTPPTELEFSKWRAWLDSLDGAGKLFFGYDVRRPLPIKYGSGFGGLLRAVSGLAFNGTTTAWSVNVARDEITLGAAASQELPVAFNLVEGDYIGLKWSTSKRSLHRVLENANSNGSGVGTWSIRPHVDPNVPGAASVNLIKADCTMAVSSRDRSAEGKARRIAFEARQHLEF